MQILLTCENSFQWFLAHSWSDLSEINKRSINRDEWQWESQEWQLVSVLIGIPGQDQVWLGHRGLQVEARESQQGDKLRDILSQWTRWPGHRVVPADLPWGEKRRHKGSCCESKSKNLVLLQASFTPYVMSGEKKKECISRVSEKVCTFQPSDIDKETLWGNADLSACPLPNCIFHC